MTEDEAKVIAAKLVSARSFATLEKFQQLVLEENVKQNLVAPSTIDNLWQRHILDSLQLLNLGADGTWIDIGTGGGFPGLVVAIASEGDRTVNLVEPRRARAAFLARAIDELELSRWTSVSQQRVEALPAQNAGVISARAVASVEKILLAGRHCATSDTRWILPRGKLNARKLDILRRNWGGVFHVEQSITEPDSSIIVATGVHKR